MIKKMKVSTSRCSTDDNTDGLSWPCRDTVQSNELHALMSYPCRWGRDNHDHGAGHLTKIQFVQPCS